MSSVTIEGRHILIPTTGTTIGILDDRGNELPMMFVGDNTVAVVFPKDDTDFQINVDNRNSDRGITFQITINTNSHWYSIDPRVKGEPMQALVANGRKLHFRSQGTGEGKQLVGQTATKYGVSFDEASEMCAKIQFEVKVEKPPPQRVVRPPVMQHFHFRHETTFCAAPTPGHDFIDSSAKGTGRPPLDRRDLGDRGVIVYGDESKQQFGNSKPAAIDENLMIKPFVIELMMQSKYGAV